MNQPEYNESSYTAATETIEADHPAVGEFTRRTITGIATETGRAVALYYSVRDTIRYDPYRIDLTIAGMKASATLSAGHGWCVSKAILLAACCRSIGIAARLGFADVRNHLTTARLQQTMNTDIFYWHGYTEMLIGDKWVKATPAFNRELCEKFRLLPLDFDGRNDSLYHPYDMEGRRHMEYVRHRGVYPDLPLNEIIETFQQEYDYPGDQSEHHSLSFDEDVERETRQ